MNIELKNIKYYASMSQETPAFIASVYRDGKFIGTASNSGTGGADSFSPATGYTHKDAPSESDVANILDQWLAVKEAKRILKMKGVTFIVGKDMKTVSGSHTTSALCAYIKSKYPDAIILTGMTPKQAAKHIKAIGA